MTDITTSNGAGALDDPMMPTPQALQNAAAAARAVTQGATVEGELGNIIQQYVFQIASLVAQLKNRTTELQAAQKRVAELETEKNKNEL